MTPHMVHPLVCFILTCAITCSLHFRFFWIISTPRYYRYVLILIHTIKNRFLVTFPPIQLLASSGLLYCRWIKQYSVTWSTVTVVLRKPAAVLVKIWQEICFWLSVLKSICIYEWFSRQMNLFNNLPRYYMMVLVLQRYCWWLLVLCHSVFSWNQNNISFVFPAFRFRWFSLHHDET